MRECDECQCGVALVWVRHTERRTGVARVLLDGLVQRYLFPYLYYLARASFVFSHTIARDALAFSQPTDAGKALAAAYCGQEYLVYKG